MTDQPKENVEDQESQVVELDVVEEVVEETYDTEGLLPEEVEMAKEHDLIVEEEKKDEEDGTDKEPEEPKTEEDTGTEEVEEEEVSDDPDNTDDMDKVFEKDEDKFHKKFTSNQKALYFKAKRDKQRRQEAEKVAEEATAKLELSGLKDSVSSKKLAAINEALADENLTVEKIQAIIAGNTKAEIEAQQKEEQAKQAVEKKKMQSRFDLTEQIGRSKYDDFDKMVDLVQEEIRNDKTGVTQQILNKNLLDTNIGEDDLADVIVRFAQLNPKFGEVTSKASPSDKENVSRAIDNSKKRKSSASVTSSGGKRMVSEEDLTPDDAVKMDDKQWMKLKPATKKRLLGG